MATPNMYPDAPALEPTRWSDVDIYEELLACYDEWREESSIVDELHRRWSTAPTDEREDRFCAYLAALDQEEAAAEAYALAVAALRASRPEQNAW
jgi:hypothetical protein